MFTKKKRCGNIKGRGCDDGWKHRGYTRKIGKLFYHDNRGNDVFMCHGCYGGAGRCYDQYTGGFPTR